MNAPDCVRNLSPSPTCFEDLVGFELIRRLVAFPTVSRDSNLELIEWVLEYVEGLGATTALTFNDDRRKANLFVTFAAQELRIVTSRSVAAICRRPSAALSRTFERIGIVVLRSTTDCAAVSSRRSSARETVISRLPVGAVFAVISESWVAVVTVFSPVALTLHRFHVWIIAAGQTVQRIQPQMHGIVSSLGATA